MVVICMGMVCAARCFAGSTDFANSTDSHSDYNLWTPNFSLSPTVDDDRKQSCNTPATCPASADPRSLEERPLVPLPTPIASGIAGLSALGVWALYKNRRRILT